MAKSKKRPAPPCQAASGLPLTKMQFTNYEIEDIAPDLSRQGAPAAWVARRFRLPPATAALVVELSGIGGAHA